MAFFVSAATADDDVPPTLAGATLISARQVHDMAGKAHLIDTRVLHDYLAGHIPGALHIHYKERSARAADFDAHQDDVPAFLARLHKFAGKKDAPLVFYCNGVSCWKSYKAAYAALKNGYPQVYWFRKGMAEWQEERFKTVAE